MAAAPPKTTSTDFNVEFMLFVTPLFFSLGVVQTFATHRLPSPAVTLHVQINTWK
jgi:hypothetical protein